MAPPAAAGNDMATCMALRLSGAPPGLSENTLMFTPELDAVRAFNAPSNPNHATRPDGSVINSLPHGMRTRMAFSFASANHSASESKSAACGSPFP